MKNSIEPSSHAVIAMTIMTLAVAPPFGASAQPRVPDTLADQYDALITSGQTFDNFGNSIDIISDLDGDGIEDIIVGDPRSDLGGLNAGRVMVFSGRTGATLLNIVGSDIESDFGNAVANAGDTNGDGVDDILVGAPFWDQPGSPNGVGDNTGRAFIYSGADGSLLQTLTPGVTPVARFSTTLDSLGDIDGDGMGDIVVGDLITAFVFSGATGAQLAEHNLGAFVVTAGVGDVNGDGTPDYAAGICRSDITATNSGEVRVFSGADHSVIWQLADPMTLALGDVLTGADVNGDGFSDLIASSKNFPGPAGTAAGRVTVFDGATGAILYRLDGFNAQDRFGRWVVNAGDLDGDLCDDLLIYAPGFSLPSQTTRTYLYSGKTGALLRTWTGTTIDPDVFVTIAVIRVADFDGDGAMDFAAPMFTGDNHTFVRGHVAIFLDSPVAPCTADQDNDQIVTSVDLAILLGSWGTASLTADINGDGIVDAVDLAQLLAQWGAWGFFNIQLP